MRIKWIKLLLILLPALVIIYWSTTSHSEVIYEDVVTMTVDGFEVPGEWVIKFSKFRSKNWERDMKKPFEDGQKWLKWLSSDNFKREEILPDGIQKNVYLKDKEKTVLAVKGKWDATGYNWFILEPNNVRPSKQFLSSWLRLVATDKVYHPKRLEWQKGISPNFIWLPGKVKVMYVYLWGGNFNYNMEAHIQDYKGNDYILPVGNLNYKGWKKFRILIPSYVRQSRHAVPTVQPLKFLRFKITSNPYEDPSEFYMYIDYFHAVTDIYQENFFGEELQFVENYWGAGSGSDEDIPAPTGP